MLTSYVLGEKKCSKAGCRCSCSCSFNSNFLLLKVRAANSSWYLRKGSDGRIVNKSSTEGVKPTLNKQH